MRSAIFAASLYLAPLGVQAPAEPASVPPQPWLSILHQGTTSPMAVSLDVEVSPREAPQAEPMALPTGAWQPAPAGAVEPDPQPSQQPLQPAPNADAAPILSRRELCDTIVEAAMDNALPVSFLTRLIWQESRFNHRAVSPVGAQGVAQFMPKTADAMGLDNPFDAREALPASARLLRTLKQQFGNLGLAAAAYNAGPRRVQDWLDRRGKLPKETRDYVLTITGRGAESWTPRKPRPLLGQVPQQVPCTRIEEFARIESAERAEAQRQEAQLVAAERKLAAERAAEKAKASRLAKAARLRSKLAGNARKDPPAKTAKDDKAPRVVRTADAASSRR
jgi:hypothetical protein